MLALMILFSILGAVALVPAALIAMFSPMAFGAPGSNNDPMVWTIFLIVASAPFVMLGCLVGAWLLYLRRHRRAAVILAAVPTAAALTGAALLLAMGL